MTLITIVTFNNSHHTLSFFRLGKGEFLSHPNIGEICCPVLILDEMSILHYPQNGLIFLINLVKFLIVIREVP